MCAETKIVRDRQRAIRREMDRRGIALKVVALDAGLSLSTIASYFPADDAKDPAMMPVSVLFALADKKALPLDLLSLLLPGSVSLVALPEGVDHHAAAAAMRDYLAAKDDAHRPDSEAGEAIGPGEHEKLTGKLVAVGGHRG